MPKYINIVIDQGTTFSKNFTVIDAAGSAIDLTGATIIAQIRRSHASSTYVDFTVNISDATNGIVVLSLLPAVTETLRPGRWVYDIKVTKADNTVIRAFEGIATVTPQVSYPCPTP